MTKKSSRRRHGTRSSARTAKPTSATPKPFPAWAKWLLGGGLFTVATYLLDLPAKVNGAVKEWPAAERSMTYAVYGLDRYAGRWTSDQALRPEDNLISDGSVPADHGEVQLWVADERTNVFHGEIETTDMQRSMLPWSRLEIDGSGGLGGFHGFITDIRGGRKVTVGAFTLTRGPGHADTLVIKPDPNTPAPMPARTVLWRTNATMRPGVMGEGFSRILREVAAEGPLPARSTSAH